jgi:hypothetical protein
MRCVAQGLAPVAPQLTVAAVAARYQRIATPRKRFGDRDRLDTGSFDHQRGKVRGRVDFRQVRFERPLIGECRAQRARPVTKQMRAGDDEPALAIGIDQRASAHGTIRATLIDNAHDGPWIDLQTCGRQRA